MRDRLLRQSICLHSQPRHRKLCVDNESLASLNLVGAHWCRHFLSASYDRIRVARQRRVQSSVDQARCGVCEKRGALWEKREAFSAENAKQFFFKVKNEEKVCPQFEM